MDERRLCEVADLKVEVTGMVRVDSLGHPVDGTLDIRQEMDITGDCPYWCVSCDEWFDTWVDATNHVEWRKLES